MDLSCYPPPGRAIVEHARRIEVLPAHGRRLYLRLEHCYSVSEHERPSIDVTGMPPRSFTGGTDELRGRATELEQAGLTGMPYLPCGPDIPGDLQRMANLFN